MAGMGGGGGGGMMGLGGAAGATGSVAADTGMTPPAGASGDVMYSPTATAQPQKDDELKRLASQLQIANSVAGLGRTLVDAGRGPGGSPLAPAPTPMPGAYTPTALRGRSPRLRDLLGSR